MPDSPAIRDQAGAGRIGAQGGADAPNAKGAASPPLLRIRNVGRGPYWSAPTEPASTLKPGPMVEERLIFLM